MVIGEALRHDSNFNIGHRFQPPPHHNSPTRAKPTQTTDNSLTDRYCLAPSHTSRILSSEASALFLQTSVRAVNYYKLHVIQPKSSEADASPAAGQLIPLHGDMRSLLAPFLVFTIAALCLPDQKVNEV